MADGFRVKVVPHDGANCRLLYGLSVAVSQFELFTPETIKKIIPKMETTIIVGMPMIAQFALQHNDNGRICSPVSCSIVAGYITKKKLDPFAFLPEIYDSGLAVYGSWGCNVAYLFHACNAKAFFWVKRCNSFMDIYHQLKKKLPTIVSVRGVLPGALKPFSQGHLMVVIGYDSATQEVVCHDPAAEQNVLVVKRYPLENFIRAWEKSHRLVYSVDSSF